MKRLLGITVLAAFMLVPFTPYANAEEQFGIYVGGHLGMSMERFSDRKYDEYWGGGITFDFSSDSGSVFGGGLLVGYDFDPRFDIPLRVELDYTVRANADAKDNLLYEDGDTYLLEMRDKISLQSLMFNAWFDIPTGTSFSPYVGGGLGFAFINFKTHQDYVNQNDPTDFEYLSGSSTETNFAWSLGGGVAYDFNENWTVDLGYRYINAGEVSKVLYDSAGDESGKSMSKVEAHDIMLGVRYTF